MSKCVGIKPLNNKQIKLSGRPACVRIICQDKHGPFFNVKSDNSLLVFQLFPFLSSVGQKRHLFVVMEIRI